LLVPSFFCASGLAVGSESVDEALLRLNAEATKSAVVVP
jgi:hypothetical protein